MKTEKSIGVIIFKKNKEIKYLLLKYERYWGFVKGNVETNETEKQTVIREATEETGIKDLNFIENFKEILDYIYKWNNNLISKQVIMFLAETKTENIRLSYEHQGYKWLIYEEALEHLKFENLKKLLEKADDLLKQQN